jgi:hypothetical protein
MLGEFMLLCVAILAHAGFSYICDRSARGESRTRMGPPPAPDGAVLLHAATVPRVVQACAMGV